NPCSCLFYRSVDHLYLYSFPTRRSSDLGILLTVLIYIPFLTTSVRTALARLTSSYSSSLALAQRELEDALVLQQLSGKLIQPGEDRKSTRLNSSHQIISYAVFCLKKKTV